MYSVDIQTTKVIAKKSFNRFIMRQKRVSSLTFRILQLPLVIERFSSSQASAKLAERLSMIVSAHQVYYM